MSYEWKNVFGAPSFCFGGASARVDEFDPKDLRLQRSRTIPGFKVGSIVAAGVSLYLGGEALDDCAMRGRAAIYHLQTDEDASSLFWNEDTLFASNVVGVKILDDQLLATVRYDRNLGIETRTSPSNGFDKRWGDENSASLESALLHIDRAGGVVGRTNFSAGLAVYAHGMEMIGRHPVLYGTVGEFRQLHYLDQHFAEHGVVRHGQEEYVNPGELGLGRPRGSLWHHLVFRSYRHRSSDNWRHNWLWPGLRWVALRFDCRDMHLCLWPAMAHQPQAARRAT